MAKNRQWGPHPSRKGVLTARAKRRGRTVKQEAEIDAHTKGTSKRAKRLRSQGIFALNAQQGKFRHAGRKMRGVATGEPKHKARKAAKRKAYKR